MISALFSVIQVDTEHHGVVLQNSRWCRTVPTHTGQSVFVRRVQATISRSIKANPLTNAGGLRTLKSLLFQSIIT
ncbi:hypothetical protein C4D60_Mb06t37420 [Musa balbisiana]|uniref:Uncharacterized protein n=1 Tax=Musa balbisiana TaxID=52838 RepID=A0A4S8IVZ7_MUSBA|nr:hypothetical protein C4D60_Mb06t37420 [Musa balbisiana]